MWGKGVITWEVEDRDAGTTMKLGGGGGGKGHPGVQRNPYPKPKTPRIWPTIFLGETPSSRVKKNEQK